MLAPISDVLLLDEKNGFRKGRYCVGRIFTVSQIIEKHREYNVLTFLAFVDLEKAFDTVNRTKLNRSKQECSLSYFDGFEIMAGNDS